ncbi:uncharacterized protein LOC141602190 [Silene latifolia]|uniref:uncharacterized protein LOC141602190 n=1 Tax=Silene latifolia TaxID=37657 RepID=UPI003D7742AB
MGESGCFLTPDCNDADTRERLWDELRQLANIVADWIVLGDFNIVRAMEERIGPHLRSLSEIMAFNQCLLDSNLDDLQGYGCEHTWTNKQDVGTRVWSKLDRVLTNASWLVDVPHALVTVLPPGISDHSPLLIQNKENYQIRRRFSYLTCWEEHKDYDTIVSEAWQIPTKGNAMFILFAKLKNVRQKLIILHKNNYSGLAAKEKDLLEKYWTLRKTKRSSLIQRAKIHDINYNDGANNYFFAKIAIRKHKSIIGNFVLLFRLTSKPGLCLSKLILLALIRKKPVVTSVMDYRPIPGCTIFYKIVSKILCDRLKPHSPTIVGKEQGAFVASRCIFENIMLTQSLIKGYGHRGISPRCMIKVDIKKAFDSLH